MAHIEKVIIENGGRYCKDPNKAMFIVQEDGYDDQIWKNQDLEGPKYIHFRFIQECIKEGAMLRTDDCLHLFPLPQKVPIKAFKNVCLEMALVPNQIELVVFESLIHLYGFTKKFTE